MYCLLFRLQGCPGLVQWLYNLDVLLTPEQYLAHFLIPKRGITNGKKEYYGHVILRSDSEYR